MVDEHDISWMNAYIQATYEINWRTTQNLHKNKTQKTQTNELSILLLYYCC